MSSRPDFDALAGSLADDPRIAAAIVFGSCARGRARPDSDLDLALLAVDDAAAQSLAADHFTLLGTLGALAGREIHLVDLAGVDATLRRAVFAHGVTLFDRSAGALARLRGATLVEYLDGDYLRRVVDAAQRRHLERAGG
ncbi:MAG: nucleotidyltransferase domain-containing protein [Gammaproteobacteria bacterium]|nr:nucleotidyltransferase domain-containing protein [Gammaproteobacteria bacterium]MCP5201664.1 nucleotidyltransferase domain-containing protein [Gammaproteobacteria bacterium]